MTRVVVLRPEPGNADTCAKLRGLGLEPLAMPVFTVVPVAWTPPASARSNKARPVERSGSAMTARPRSASR